jgi:hypothetical protein
MRSEQAACFHCQSWVGYTINMFEFEFPTGTRRYRICGDAFNRDGAAEMLAGEPLKVSPISPVVTPLTPGHCDAEMGRIPF